MVNSAINDDRLTITVEEAARVLGIGRNSCYEAVRRGEIPAVRLGRRLLIPRQALENLLTSSTPPDGAARIASMSTIANRRRP